MSAKEPDKRNLVPAFHTLSYILPPSSFPMNLTWLGHACWSIATGQHNLLIDPYLDDNPTAAVKADAVAADFILLTHGHFDHVADAVKIAKRTGANCVANYEICEWLGKQGVGSTTAMNLGGGVNMPFGRVKMTVALHSSTLPDGTPGGNPGQDFCLTIGARRGSISRATPRCSPTCG